MGDDHHAIAATLVQWIRAGSMPPDDAYWWTRIVCEMTRKAQAEKPDSMFSNNPIVKFLMVLVVALLSTQAHAQTVTVAKPGATPATFDCSVAPGCTIAVAPAVVPPPPPPPCSWTVAPLAVSVSDAPGGADITVTPSAVGCAWTASSTVGWVSVAALPEGVAGLTILRNTATSPRVGTVTVAGQVVTVTQAGAPAPPPPPPPAAGVIARVSNFRSMGDSPFHTQRVLTSQGPGNTDVMEFVQRTSSSQGQYYLGWQMLNGPNPSTPVRYFRGRIFIPGPPYHGAFDNKLIIHGEGSDSNRMICELRDNGQSASTLGITCTKNIDGGGRYVPFVLGQWNDYQIEVNANGPIKIWVNNNTYASPSSQTASKSFNTAPWGAIGLGYYGNVRSATPNGVVIFRHSTDFEVATSFDPAWHR